jgi:hypothetical protein
MIQRPVPSLLPPCRSPPCVTCWGATLGFDHLLAPWATLAVDLISQLQGGDSPLQIPPPVHIEAPYHRTIIPTVIPDSRDDIVYETTGSSGSSRTGSAVRFI